MTLQEIENIPYYSWDCLTLKLPHRDVELVIKDEYNMKQFLKFLIHSIQTIDG